MKLISRILTGVLIAGSFTTFSTAANASTQCDSQELALRTMIASSSRLTDITNAASQFRVCMEKQADSANARQDSLRFPGVYPTGPFFAIFTSRNVLELSGGRSLALAAAADYRYSLDGLSPFASPTSNCDIYLNLARAGVSMGDISLGALGQQAYTSCYASLQVSPRGSVSIAGKPVVGTSLRADIRGSFDVGIAYQWMRGTSTPIPGACLLYTSDAADE